MDRAKFPLLIVRKVAADEGESLGSSLLRLDRLQASGRAPELAFVRVQHGLKSWASVSPAAAVPLRRFKVSRKRPTKSVGHFSNIQRL